MKISERLQQKIERDLGIKVDVPERIQRGRSGKAAGQWAWSAKRLDGLNSEIDSEDTMADCVASEKLSTYTCCRPGREIHIVAGS